MPRYPYPKASQDIAVITASMDKLQLVTHEQHLAQLKRAAAALSTSGGGGGGAEDAPGMPLAPAAGAGGDYAALAGGWVRVLPGTLTAARRRPARGAAARIHERTHCNVTCAAPALRCTPCKGHRARCRRWTPRAARRCCPASSRRPPAALA